MRKVTCDICKQELPVIGNIGRVQIRAGNDPLHLLEHFSDVCEPCLTKWTGASVEVLKVGTCDTCGNWKYESEEPPPVPQKPVMAMVNGLPRRCRIDLFTPAEKSIADAMAAVESAGAHQLLTEAVMLLGQAKNKVADFVESQGNYANVGTPATVLPPSQE